MTDQDVRDLLERMAAEEPIPSFDAAPLTRRARHRAARTVVVGAVGVAAAIAVLFAGVAQIQTTPLPAELPTPSVTSPPSPFTRGSTRRSTACRSATRPAGGRGRRPSPGATTPSRSTPPMSTSSSTRNSGMTSTSPWSRSPSAVRRHKIGSTT
jgi:hypothetical protein